MVYPKWPVQFFEMKNVAGLNYLLQMQPKGQHDLRSNKDLHQRKLVFLLPSIVIESASLDVVI